MDFHSKFKIKNLKFSGLAAVLLFFLAANAATGETAAPADIPRRVISLSPNLTEIIYDIGAQDLVVGVTDFCKFPPQARQKEKVGGWINPNFEKIVSLKPDLVVSPKFYGRNEGTLRKLGIPVVILDCVTLEDILGAYDVLGGKLGRPAAAKKARRKFEKRLGEIGRRAKGGKSPSVLFVIGRTPGTLSQIYGVGPRNFVDELIRKAGGRNILADSPESYPLVSREVLLRRDPDIIIDALPASEVKPGDFAREAAVWKKMPSLRAVQKGNVHCFSDEGYLIPGPSLLGLADYLSGIFRRAGSPP